jgi:electron transport complex protein RnfG
MSAAIEHAAPLPKQTSSAYMIFVMTAVATLCGLLIVSVYQLTSPAIARNQAKIVEESVYEVLPLATRQVAFAIDITKNRITAIPDGQTPLPKIYAGYDDAGALVGIAIQGNGRGYQDVIRVMYSYSPDCGCINGFKVLDHKETPGLGDKIITNQDFQANFEKLDATLDPATDTPVHPIVTVKHGTKSEPWEIDAISGATISSKAIGKIMEASTNEMLPIITEHLDEIRKAGTS